MSGLLARSPLEGLGLQEKGIELEKTGF